jgi:hypothetical protein
MYVTDRMRFGGTGTFGTATAHRFVGMPAYGRRLPQATGAT